MVMMSDAGYVGRIFGYVCWRVNTPDGHYSKETLKLQKEVSFL